MKEKKKKIIILSIAIVAVIAIIAGSTYAYWQITQTQENPNDIVAACLDITMENETGTFGLDKAWPISDSEGQALEGFTFEVTNNCQDSVNYIVGMNSVEGSSTDYLAYSSIRVKLDGKESSLFSEFGDIGYSDPKNTQVVRDSKLLSMESLEGGGTNTHNVKVWIDKDAPVTEQGKIFSGQVFITGGQGVPIYDDCFAINTDGAIMGYDYSCGYAVEVPATIAGIEVKTINAASFAMSNMQVYGLYNEGTDEGKVIYYVTDENIADEFIDFAKQNMCEDPTTCTLEDIEAMGLKIITTEEEFNAIDFEQYETDGYVIEGPEVYYFNPETSEFDAPSYLVSTLDLSEAIYLETIGEYAFGYNQVLENVILPSDGVLTTIGESAFEKTNLKEIIIPSSVKTIGNSAFDGGSEGAQLQTLVFEGAEDSSSQLETIGERAFYRNQISNIDLPSSLSSIGTYAFFANQLTELNVGAKTIGNNAFEGNKLLSVMIENSVEKIESYAFIGGDTGNQIATLTIEEDSVLSKIGDAAFSGNSIGNITIPASVTSVGYDAFNNNGAVSNLVISRGSNLVSVSSRAFSGLNVENAVISTSAISGAFSGSTIKNVTILNNVESISGLGGLAIENLTFEDTEENPSQLTTIADSAFANNSISSVVIPDSVTSLSGFNDNSLTEVTIPDSVTNIGTKAFDGNGLTLLSIPKSVTNISENAFNNNMIATLTFETSSSIQTIGKYAFYCNKLTEVAIPSSIQSLGDWSFAGKYTGMGIQCSDGNNLASFTFEDTTTNPSQLTTIGNNVFVGNALTKFVIPGTITSIGTSPFADNLGLTEIIIKKADNSNITFGTNWNRIDVLGTAATIFAKVTYDPDYTE